MERRDKREKTGVKIRMVIQAISTIEQLRKLIGVKNRQWTASQTITYFRQGWLLYYMLLQKLGKLRESHDYRMEHPHHPKTAEKKGRFESIDNAYVMTH